MAALLLAAAVVAGCTGDSGGARDGPAPGTYEIAFLGDLSGLDAPVATSMRNAVVLAVEEVAAGAEEGVTIVARELGAPALRSGDDSVVGIVATAAAAPALAGTPAPVLAPGLPRPPVTSPVRFVAPVGVAGMAAALAVHVTGPLAASRVAFFDAGGGEALRSALTAAGVELVVDATLDPDAASYPEAVASARALSPPPEVVVYSGGPDPAARLARQLTEAGIRSRLVSDARLLTSAFVEAAGAAASDGAHLVCDCVSVLPLGDGPAPRFFHAYEQRWGGPPGPYAAESYAAARLLAEGILAGNDTRGELRRHVGEQVEVEVVGRPVPLDSGGGVAPGIYEIRDGGYVALEA